MQWYREDIWGCLSSCQIIFFIKNLKQSKIKSYFLYVWYNNVFLNPDFVHTFEKFFFTHIQRPLQGLQLCVVMSELNFIANIAGKFCTIWCRNFSRCFFNSFASFQIVCTTYYETFHWPFSSNKKYKLSDKQIYIIVISRKVHISIQCKPSSHEYNA